MAPFRIVSATPRRNVEDFERFGEFWNADRPDHRVPGILRGKAPRCEIELFDALAGDSPVAAINRESFPLVLGDLHASAPKGGTRVSLIDARVIRTSWGSTLGRKLQTLAASEILLGNSHVERTPVFPSATIEIARLGEWLGMRAFSWKHEAIVFDQPPSECVNLENARLEFATTFHTTFSGTRDDAHISSELSAEVVFRAPLSPAEIVRQYVVPLRNLVSLASGKFAPIRTIEYAIPNGDESSSDPEVAPEAPPRVYDLALHFRETRGSTRHVPTGVALRVSSRRRGTSSPLGSLARNVSNASTRPRPGICAARDSAELCRDQRFELTIRALDLVAKQIAKTSRADLLLSFAGVTELVGDTRGFLAALDRQAADLWVEDAPAGPQLTYMTQAIEWVLWLVLAREAGVSVDAIVASRPFRRDADRLRQLLAVAKSS